MWMTFKCCEMFSAAMWQHMAMNNLRFSPLSAHSAKDVNVRVNSHTVMLCLVLKKDKNSFKTPRVIQCPLCGRWRADKLLGWPEPWQLLPPSRSRRRPAKLENSQRRIWSWLFEGEAGKNSNSTHSRMTPTNWDDIDSVTIVTSHGWNPSWITCEALRLRKSTLLLASSHLSFHSFTSLVALSILSYLYSRCTSIPSNATLSTFCFPYISKYSFQQFHRNLLRCYPCLHFRSPQLFLLIFGFFHIFIFSTVLPASHLHLLHSHIRSMFTNLLLHTLKINQTKFSKSKVSFGQCVVLWKPQQTERGPNVKGVECMWTKVR